jgi:hypothetical protein
MINTEDRVFSFSEIARLVDQGHISLEFGASLNALFYNDSGLIVSTQPCTLDESGKLVPAEDDSTRESPYGWSSAVSTKEILRLKLLLVRLDSTV